MSTDTTKRTRGPLDDRFESGYVPADEPPGITEREYADWKKAGGKVTKSIDEDQEEPGRARFDDELKTISAMLRLLDKLDSESAKSRVVNYISDRFCHQQQQTLERR